MEYRTLGKTDLEVSIISFGAAPLGSEYRKIDESEGISAVHTALDLGVNFIDTSPYYGRTKSEIVLGKALRTVNRNQYYLATKVGRYDLQNFDFTADRVIESVDQSLTRLNTDYIDLIQCHDIEFVDLNIIVNETIPASMQLFTNKGAPSWHPADKEIKEVCIQAAKHCRNKNTDISELSLQFSLANSKIHTTLMGTANPTNVKKNIACVGRSPNTQLLSEVLEILDPIRNKTWISGRLENN